MLFQDPKLFYEIKELTTVDCHRLLDYTLPQMSFQEDDTVLDIGCGPGDNTRDVIRARIPKLKKLVAIDILPQMIEFAKTHFPHEKIEYHVADMEDRRTCRTKVSLEVPELAGCNSDLCCQEAHTTPFISSLKPWEGSVSKAFSVHCFYLFKDQRNAFQNLYDLLKPNGEAALVFLLSLRFWDFYPEMINCEKWNRYLKDADQRIPDSHRLNLGADHYRKFLEDLGFEVLLCKDEDRSFLYSDDDLFKNVLKSILALPYYIPEEMRDHFLDELFNCILRSDGRNFDGQLAENYRTLTVHIRKR